MHKIHLFVLFSILAISFATVNEAAKPRQETPKPTQETVKPTQETAKPTQKTPEPTQEAVKPSQEKAKPAEETPKPAAKETPKPAQETPKPTQETVKPQEAPKPTQESVKPAQETVKATQETPKPAQETPKPAQETPKPAQETPKPAQETVKPQETPKPAQQTAKPVQNNNGEFDVEALLKLMEVETAQVMKNRTYVDGKIWKYPPYLGLRFISEYYVCLHYLGLENKTVFNTATYKQIALSGQLENGSWKQLEDPMVTDGQIDSTILAYWCLKVIGDDINAPHMKKAREWILNYGGIEKASTLTKYFLALFGQYDYESMVFIPLQVLYNHSYFQYTYADNFVGQWVTPHLVAMAYLRYFKIGKDMGPKFSVAELYPEPFEPKLYNVEKPFLPDFDMLNTIEKQLGIQQHNGGFGAYTVSSLFNMAALMDFDKQYPGLYTEKINIAVKKAFHFLEFTYVTAPGAEYKGMLMDGTWWDNILISYGMLEAGVAPEKVSPTMEHIMKEGQVANGGFCYGYGFEYAPDTDDTALAVQTLIKLGDKYKAQVKKAVEWLIFMQNDDGGFGAFHKNKNINPFISLICGKIADSAELFDQSSVDLTAHVMEAWAAYGYTCEEPFVQKAISYIKKQQYYFGSWEARWATNYLHTAGNVVSALGKLKCDMSESWIKKAVAWGLSKQNEDGGWGESYKSYDRYANMEGIGISTPTHTAWMLFGLIEVADLPEYSVTDQILKGIKFLQQAHKKHGQWLDESPVGTGHRGILTMQYPAYSKSFPVTAIARFLRKFGEGKVCNRTNNFCRKPDVDSYSWEGPGDEL